MPPSIIAPLLDPPLLELELLLELVLLLELLPLELLLVPELLPPAVPSVMLAPLSLLASVEAGLGLLESQPNAAMVASAIHP